NGLRTPKELWRIRRRRPDRPRPLDADAARRRHRRPVRLARDRRQADPPAAHTRAAPALPVEPRLGDRASAGRARAVRAREQAVRHLALAVTDQERSRCFYESYFGFGARPSRWYDDGVLMLYNAEGFSLALGPT